MALALDHHPAHRRTAHLRLVEPLDPTPVGMARVSRSTYVRRRMTVGIALLVIVGGVLFASRAQANEAQGASTPQYVIAQEGDTLWRIAEQVAPNAPVSEVVDALVQLNGTSLRVGQVVLIP